MKTKILALTLLLFGLSACGPAAPTVWEGTQTGTQNGSAISTHFTLTLLNDGSGKGWFLSYLPDKSGFGMGTVTTTRSGDMLTVTYAQGGQRCMGTATSTITVQGDSMTGDFTGSNADAAPTDPGTPPGGIACGAVTSTLILRETR